MAYLTDVPRTERADSDICNSLDHVASILANVSADELDRKREEVLNHSQTLGSICTEFRSIRRGVQQLQNELCTERTARSTAVTNLETAVKGFAITTSEEISQLSSALTEFAGRLRQEYEQADRDLACRLDSEVQLREEDSLRLSGTLHELQSKLETIGEQFRFLPDTLSLQIQEHVEVLAQQVYGSSETLQSELIDERNARSAKLDDSPSDLQRDKYVTQAELRVLTEAIEKDDAAVKAHLETVCALGEQFRCLPDTIALQIKENEEALSQRWRESSESLKHEILVEREARNKQLESLTLRWSKCSESLQHEFSAERDARSRHSQEISSDLQTKYATRAELTDLSNALQEERRERSMQVDNLWTTFMLARAKPEGQSDDLRSETAEESSEMPSSSAWEIGERVECRNRDETVWKLGTVMEVISGGQPMVKPDGGPSSGTYQVRRLHQAPSSPSEETRGDRPPSPRPEPPSPSPRPELPGLLHQPVLVSSPSEQPPSGATASSPGLSERSTHARATVNSAGSQPSNAASSDLGVEDASPKTKSAPSLLAGARKINAAPTDKAVASFSPRTAKQLQAAAPAKAASEASKVSPATSPTRNGSPFRSRSAASAPFGSFSAQRSADRASRSKTPPPDPSPTGAARSKASSPQSPGASKRSSLKQYLASVTEARSSTSRR